MCITSGHASEISVNKYVLHLFFCCIVASSEEDSDGDSSGSKSSSSNNKSQDARTTEQPARILTDQELNQLGAKILRAEMMGDEVCLISVFFSNI